MAKCEVGCTCLRHTSRTKGTKLTSNRVRLFTCEDCGVTKQRPGMGAPKKYCDDCLYKEQECACGCGEIARVYRGDKGYIHGHMGRVNAHYLPVRYGEDNPSCRPEVREKLRQMRLGDKNPNWNENWSWDQYAPYQKVFYACKNVVWKRDGGQCQCCGLLYNPEVKKRTHVVHHIDEDPTHNVIENLILLCRKCHRNVHSGTIQCPQPKDWESTHFGDIRVGARGGTQNRNSNNVCEDFRMQLHL